MRLFSRTSGKQGDGKGITAIIVPTNTPGFKVDIASCDGQWCAVSATDHPASGRPSTYSGYLPQSEIWGVYRNEKFD